MYNFCILRNIKVGECIKLKITIFPLLMDLKWSPIDSKTINKKINGELDDSWITLTVPETTGHFQQLMVPETIKHYMPPDLIWSTQHHKWSILAKEFTVNLMKPTDLVTSL